MNVLEDDQVVINLNGSVGQSFGAFSVKGTTLKYLVMLMIMLQKVYLVVKL